MMSEHNPVFAEMKSLKEANEYSIQISSYGRYAVKRNMEIMGVYSSKPEAMTKLAELIG